MNIALYNFREFNPNIGGIERVSVSLAKGLIDKGYNVIFIAVYKSKFKIEYDIPASQFFLPNIDTCSKDNIEVMRKILLEQNIDILINQDSHSLASHNLAYSATFHTNVKLFSALHFGPSTRLLLYKYPIDRNMFTFKENVLRTLKCIAYKWPFRQYFLRNQRYHYRKMYNESEKVILLSDKFIQEYCKIAGLREHNKLCAINNVLSFKYEDVELEKENRIMFCSRIESQKRPERALYVWKHIYKKLPNWKLDIIGDGTQLEKLKQLANRLKLERVVFHGFKKPKYFYMKSKIFLMTSDYEGWGLTLTEAMQYKCVPIALNTYASVYDIIDNDKNGYIISGVDCRKMADKVYHLASNSKELDRMARSAFIKASGFVPNVIIDKWIEILECRKK